MKRIKIERLANKEGIRFIQEPEGLTGTITYTDMLKKYLADTKLQWSGEHGVLQGMMAKLMNDDDYLTEVLFLQFGSEDVVEIVYDRLDHAKLSFTVTQTTHGKVFKRELHSVEGFIEVDSTKIEFSFTVFSLLNFINLKTDPLQHLTEEEFLKATPRFQKAFILSYLKYIKKV